MSLKTGGGDYLYEVVEEWGEMPNKWMYDIAGVASRPSSILDLHTMMQNLLVERFKLQLHHETKEMPAYVLTVRSDRG